MNTLSVDIETFSSVDIKKSGLYKYAESPDFEVLLFAYSLNGEPVQIVDLKQGEVIPRNIIHHLRDHNTLKTAYNAAFEWYCLNRAGYQTPIYQWHCTMAQGLYAGYTAGLSATGEALGLPQDKRKLGTGTQLIRTFCVPRNPTKTDSRVRVLPHHEPEKWRLFKEYCVQDVVTEMAIAKKLEAFQMPDFEQELWCIDVVMNAKGIAIDKQLVDGAIYIGQTVNDEQIEEAKQISGLDNPKSIQQLKKFLEKELPDDLLDDNGELENIDKKTVAGLLDSVDDGRITRLLQLKQEFSKTSNKKYVAMDEALCQDGRVKGLLQYYGANRTGRWAGRLVQVQNLPRNHSEILDLARDLVKARNISALKLIFGNVPDILSQLIRTAFIPSPGNTFLVSDYSAIEARVIAWLANEKWRQDVFATHGKIYEASASAMFGVPIDKITKGNPEYDLRQKGKIAELALGYQGGPGALKAMGALEMGLTEEELPDIVQRWRQANKNIVGLWYAVDSAALSVMHTGKPVYTNQITIAREFDIKNGMDYLTVQLPSSRKLYYAHPHLGTNRFGQPSILYWGMDQVKKKWTELETYGGKLTENIVQAIARDCLAHTIKKLEHANYHIIMHVHDEVIVDAPIGTPLDAVTSIMGEPIPWAPGLLLRGDGYETSYYKKD